MAGNEGNIEGRPVGLPGAAYFRPSLRQPRPVNSRPDVFLCSVHVSKLGSLSHDLIVLSIRAF